jgi:hypothetical protein
VVQPGGQLDGAGTPALARRVVAPLSPSAVHVIAAATWQLCLLVDAEEQEGREIHSDHPDAPFAG